MKPNKDNGGVRLLILLTAAVALMGVQASAQSISGYEAEYTIDGNTALAEITLHFRDNLSEFETGIPEDAAEVEVTGLEFEVSESGTQKILKVTGQRFGSANIEYFTSSVLEKSRDSEFFVLSVERVDAGNKSVAVRLPEKAALKYGLESGQASIVPKAGEVGTDGRRIVIKWENEDLSGDALLIIYDSGEAFGFATALVYAAVGLSLLMAGWAYYHYWKKDGRSKKEPTNELTRNLIDDEKKVVEALIKSPEEGTWQKQLETMTGLSKVRLSRKVRNLEQKGLIEKIPYGNANRIRLKKV